MKKNPHQISAVATERDLSDQDRPVQSPAPSPGSGAHRPIRMLYVVGGGPGIAERVDVSDLFAKRLARKGFEIDWVIHDPEAGQAWQDTTWRGALALVVGRSSHSGLAGQIGNKIRDLSADLRTFWLVLRSDYDVVQVRDKFLVGVIALLAARLRGIKFTYWASYPFAECRIVDAQEGRSRMSFLSVVGGKLAGWLLYNIILPYSDWIFVQSQQMLEDFCKEGVSPQKMTPVPMGINEDLLEHPPCPVTPHTVLYLGTLNLVRRLDTLVDALAIVRQRFPDVRLIFVGEGDVPEDRQRL